MESHKTQKQEEKKHGKSNECVENHTIKGDGLSQYLTKVDRAAVFHYTAEWQEGYV